MMPVATITTLIGDCREMLKTLESESVHTVVTSPPYWGLRDYGVAGQMGLEETPAEYVAALVEVFQEIWRVLRKDGTVWLNLGDSYAGEAKGSEKGLDKSTLTGKTENRVPIGKAGINKITTGFKRKDLIGIPWRVAFALQADGWYLRSEIIWHKPNAMPESVSDRPTKAHETIFLLAKNERYYYDADAIREKRGDEPSQQKYQELKQAMVRRSDNLLNYGSAGPGPRYTNPNGRNKRSVWVVANQPYAEPHFATYPEKLIEPCILAGCPAGGVVLDPFAGSGTTGRVAIKHGRNAVLIELNSSYLEQIDKRTDGVQIHLSL